jgi:hypothetical protein
VQWNEGFLQGRFFARGGFLQGVVFCKGWSFAMERRVCFCNERFFCTIMKGGQWNKGGFL